MNKVIYKHQVSFNQKNNLDSLLCNIEPYVVFLQFNLLLGGINFKKKANMIKDNTNANVKQNKKNANMIH